MRSRGTARNFRAEIGNVGRRLSERERNQGARCAGLYQIACEGGELVGCTNLGLMYAFGAGATLNLARAAGLYQTACEGGERLACSLRADAERFSRSGRVGDAESERPLSLAIVELPDLGIREVSDASGRIVLTGLLPGIHRLRVERVGYTVLDGELEVQAAETSWFSLTGRS